MTKTSRCTVCGHKNQLTFAKLYTFAKYTYITEWCGLSISIHQLVKPPSCKGDEGQTKEEVYWAYSQSFYSQSF